MFDYTYAYLLGAVLTFCIWIVIFMQRKDLRTEMLVLSLFILCLAPTNIIYYGTYWKPLFVFDFYHIGIESLLVCFAYGGVVGVLYEYFFKRTPVQLQNVSLRRSFLHMLSALGIGTVIIIFMAVFTHINFIYISSIGMFIAGIILLLWRKDLLIPSLFSGLFTTILAILVYQLVLLCYPYFFDKFWIPDTITNIRLLGVPLEEYIFHIALGMSVGILFKVGSGTSVVNFQKNK